MIKKADQGSPTTEARRPATTGSNNTSYDYKKISCCPYGCNTCGLLGDYVKTRYEIDYILAENDRSIFFTFW